VRPIVGVEWLEKLSETTGAIITGRFQN